MHGFEAVGRDVASEARQRGKLQWSLDGDWRQDPAVHSVQEVRPEGPAKKPARKGNK